MESVTRLVERHAELATGQPTERIAEVPRALAVTATYLLSEEGRKASLLAGSNGRALQDLKIHVPANRLHLVSVDKHGVARLKLRPRYELDDVQPVVRIDAPPTYDAPPGLDDLFRAAARNHELERAFTAERTAERSKRRESARDSREQLAQAFLADPAQRALAHPAPSPRRCLLQAERGRVLFDVTSDEGLAKQVPAEAHRRFRADLRARDEQNLQQRAAQLAVHEEKKRFIADWIAAHGTEEQRVRQAAGVLPMAEAVEAIADHEFTALAERPIYRRDGPERLQAYLRRQTGDVDVVVAPADLVLLSTNAVKATAEQWAVVQEIQAAVPDARVTLREHRLSSKRHSRVPALVIFGVLVSKRVGPFVVRREYGVSE